MRRGFTLIELAIVISILGILVPSVYAVYRQMEVGYIRIETRLDAGRAARSFSEELRRDLWTHRLAKGSEVALEGAAPCERILYEVQEGVLWRKAPDACGGARAIARNAGALSRDGSGILFVYRRHLRPELPFDVPVRVGLSEVSP